MIHSFGTGATMRGKHNCTPAWVSLETHGAVENVFPPIVITSSCKRSSVKKEKKIEKLHVRQNELGLEKRLKYIN